CLVILVFRASTQIWQACSIRHQSACENMLANLKHRRNSVVCEEVDDLLDMQLMKWIAGHEQRIGMLAQQGGQARIKLGDSTRLHRNEAHAQGRHSRSDLVAKN